MAASPTTTRDGIFSRKGSIRRPGPVAIAVTPLAAFLCLAGFVRIRRRSGLAGRGRARAVAREVLSLCGQEGTKNRETDEIFAAFRKYLRVRFDLLPTSPDFADVDSRLPKPDVSARVAELYTLYNELRFSPGGGQKSGQGLERYSSGCAGIVAELERGAAK